MRLLASAVFLFACALGCQAGTIVLTFDEFAIDSAHQFIDISNYYNGGYANDASGRKGPGPNYGLTAYPGSTLVAWGYPSNPSDVGLRIPSFPPSGTNQSAPGGFVFSRGITGSFSFVSEGDTGHTALLVSALDAKGNVLAEDFVGQDVTTFTLRFPGVANKILLGAPDANHPGPLDAPGYWHFDAVTFTQATGYPAVWRPSNGTWYGMPLNGSNPVTQQWGLPGDVPVPGDYDGDGQIDFAVWRPANGTWYVIPSADPAGPITQQWGLPGDVPLAGDFDGDGQTDFAVWRPANGTWYIIPSKTPDTPIMQQWGLSGDVPLAGDFDGDGKTDFAVWRPREGNWYITPSKSPNTPFTQQWGLPGDVPLAGDFDGDGKTDFTVWRPAEGNWYIIPSGNSGSPITQQWGLPGDVPLAGDFDGDGKTDFTVWRPAEGNWYITPSGNPNSPITQQWGFPGDVPVNRAPGS
jgi:hypothetical protein